MNKPNKPSLTHPQKQEIANSITAQEVQQAILQVGRKSLSWDLIPIQYFRDHLRIPEMLQLFTRAVRMLIRNENTQFLTNRLYLLQDIRKQGRSKTGAPSMATTRPIAITSTLKKIIEGIFLMRSQRWMEKSISKYQLGYKTHKSSEMHLMRLC